MFFKLFTLIWCLNLSVCHMLFICHVLTSIIYVKVVFAFMHILFYVGSFHPVITQHSYDNVEEHFKRSLGVNYQRSKSRQLSLSVSVDDHFAKALGEKWIQLKASSSSCNISPSQFSSSSSSPSSSIFIHSLGSDKSSKKACKTSVSPITTTSNTWSGQWKELKMN